MFPTIPRTNIVNNFTAIHDNLADNIVNTAVALGLIMMDGAAAIL